MAMAKDNVKANKQRPGQELKMPAMVAQGIASAHNSVTAMKAKDSEWQLQGCSPARAGGGQEQAPQMTP